MKTLFDPAALQAVVSRHLEGTPAIPAGARGAFLTVANEAGIKAVIAVKVNDQWTVEAVAAVAWHRTEDGPPLTYGVKVTGVF